MKSLMRVVLLLSLAVFVAANAWAQAAATGELHVTVKDPNGAVIKNATVTARNQARNIERTTQTNTDGQYPLTFLPPGDYTLTVEAPSFAKLVAPNVRVTIGQIGELPVTLQLATVSEVVNVSAVAEMVETQRSTVTTTIEERKIENLPINGRNYINFTMTDSKATRDTAPSIGAAPTSGVNFSGQRARSNLVNVDGADAVDNSTNGIRSTVSQEAVQEFQILTNGYAPEYGRAAGGVVNIITKSGTNDFHGSAFGYLRNRKFQAVNPFSNVSDPAYTRVQTGLTLSGPIKKDRTFYFFSYETTRRQETGFSTIGANNFGLVDFNTTLIGRPFGTIKITPEQVAFLTNPKVLELQGPTAPQPVRDAVTSLVNSYVVLAGGAGDIALNKSWAPLAGLFPAGSASVFPTSGAPLPASYVGLNSLRGNYPVHEGTSLWSARIDHRINNHQQFTMRVGVSPSTVTGIQVNAQNQNFGQNAYSRTSEQTYRDFSVTGQHTWTSGTNKVNEFRFQAARRGLIYNFSSGPGGSAVAVDVIGYAFFGREPFSFVRRTEKRFQFTDNFSILAGSHNIKFGADVNYLPLAADFTVNFGGLFKFGTIDAKSFLGTGTVTGLDGSTIPIPGFNSLQTYGLGMPQVYVQGIGNPHDEFTNTPIGLFWQDTWHVNSRLTLNYGVRYDVEFTPVFAAVNQLSADAEKALGITQGIPRDYNNFAPRLGLAWDPWGNGKTVIRASAGMFYDHPLLALAFDSDVADGSQAPQVLMVGDKPSSACTPPTNLNATNVFQGILNTSCLGVGSGFSFGYLPQEQRFDMFLSNSIWTNQRYLDAHVPLSVQPFGLPVGRNFQYAYSNQANLTLERDLGHDYALSLEYNFNGGHHLPRPINVNNTRPDLLTQNWQRAVNYAVANGQPIPSAPIFVTTYGTDPVSGKDFVPAALVSFFRPSGLNPSIANVSPPALVAMANGVLSEDGLGLGTSVPFSDMIGNLSNGSSVYHGMTASLRKRFNRRYEFLASYTWSHAIDDSTDLQTLLAPQDNYRPYLERASSSFDQRHRFVFSGVYQSGKVGSSGFAHKLLSDWRLAPIIEISSGRPFNILTGTDRNFDFSSSTDRPMVVAANAGTNLCGDPVVASKYSPTGFFQLPCFLNGTFSGNLGRNAGVRPTTIFTDMRVSRGFKLTERVGLEAIADMFNLINRFNVADVNSLFTQAGTPTAAFDPRQFQFALKLTW